MVSSEGATTEHALRFNFKTSNSGAEYEAFIANLRMAKELNVKKLKVFMDSQLIVGQVWSHYES